MEEEFHELVYGYRACIGIGTGYALFDEENSFINAFASQTGNPVRVGIGESTLLSCVTPHLYQIQEIPFKRDQLPDQSRASKNK
jgi:hypothetical protein